MPRKDTITGAMVMTHAEFWAAEAEREGEGRSGGDDELIWERID